MVTIPREQLEQSLIDAESNIASYLQWIGLEEWSATLPARIDLFVGVGLGLVALAYIAWKILRNPHRADLKAATQTPGNGWRVSRLIMRVWTLRKAESLCRDFLAQPQKTDEVRVRAARALRQHEQKAVPIMSPRDSG